MFLILEFHNLFEQQRIQYSCSANPLFEIKLNKNVDWFNDFFYKKCVNFSISNASLKRFLFSNFSKQKLLLKKSF